MARPGYLKLHRALADKPIWKQSTPEHKVILIQLLIMADFSPNEWEYKGKVYQTRPGQFVTSLQSIADECGKGVSLQNVRSALARFERLGFITNKTTKINRLITIVNWGIYQSQEEKSNKDTNIVTNKEVTKHQQRGNKEVTTKEEVKNLRSKEGKNNNYYNNAAAVVKRYEELGFGFCDPYAAQQINEWLDTFSHDVIIKCIELSANLNKKSMHYVNRVLRDWNNRGLDTVEKIDAAEKKRESDLENKNKQGPKTYQQRMRERQGESKPSWMDKEQDYTPVDTSTMKTAADDPELLAMINGFRNGVTE